MAHTLNPYAAVTGVIPTRREMADWPSRKFLLFLEFCNLFMVEKDGEWKITITEDRLRQAERFLAVPHHGYQEFLWRINKFSTDPDVTTRQFYYKLAGCMRQVLGYLKLNPAQITDEMRAIITPNPRFNWCLNHTKVQTLRSGAEVVVADTLDAVSYQKHQVSSPNAEKMMIDAMIKTASLYNMIADSIKKEHIKDLDTKDKIAALSKLSFIHGAARNWKPTSMVFNKINVNAAGAKELEGALLAFSEEESRQ